jgi:hypothetical protein
MRSYSSIEVLLESAKYKVKRLSFKNKMHWALSIGPQDHSK